jgi:hypothetical protein
MNFSVKKLFQPKDNYQLTSWLFLRGIAFVYAIAFLSLGLQIDGLAGPNGIVPFAETLTDAYRERGWHAWWQIPNIFWIDASDLALQLAAYGGFLLSVILFLGRWQLLAMIGMYVLYVSLFLAGDQFLSFQWDTLLLEAGFLAIFLIRGGPNVVLIFMFHWLLFRFRFMSGFFKVYNDDPTWLDFTALHYYFETQVLPHAGSWYFHHLPNWLQSGGVLYVYFTELLVPFFIFLPRPFRIAAALITIFTQLLIMTTSNHNFINILVIVLCLFLLDDRFLQNWTPRRLWTNIQTVHLSVTGSLFKMTLSICSVLIFVSSVSIFAWRTLPVKLPPVMGHTFSFMNRVGIGHIFHVYGIMQVERQELEIQGSNDGVTWQAYEFRFKPGPVEKRPPVNIPHQPRLDWMMWFLPPQRKDETWFVQFLQRLHEGSPQVLKLLENNPFKELPPRYLRVVAYEYRFTTPDERAATGHWWKRRYLGIFPFVKPRNP